MSYRTLEIWQLARGLTIVVHSMTVEMLPSFNCTSKGRRFGDQ